MLVSGSALAVASLRSGDPWVVIPMLSLSELAFLYLCIAHSGKWQIRLVFTILIAATLTLIGARVLGKPTGIVASKPASETAPAASQAKEEPSPRVGVQIQLMPGLSVDAQDTRVSGAVVQFWNNTKEDIKNSDVILEMPPLKRVKKDAIEYDPARFGGSSWSRFQILAGTKRGARFIHLWAKYLEPNEHHFVEVEFEHKYEVGNLDEWGKKYHYGSGVALEGQYVMGTPMATKDLAP